MSLPLSVQEVAQRIDHSLLSPTLGGEALELGCRLAAEYGVASVCIKPYAVKLASRILAGTNTAVGTTVGFPHGGHSTAIKVIETELAIAEGATELDMVVNIGQVLAGEWNSVADDIAAVTSACHRSSTLVKVIFENCYLNDTQKIRLCQICEQVGADYIKTSTGYGTSGATLDDLRLMRQSAGPKVKLKAAGGVRDLDTLLKVIELGCDRVGLSRTAELLDELRSRVNR